ncbi:MAG: hypothetical protein AAFQ94_21140 [Bacteroidota bacterium]
MEDWKDDIINSTKGMSKAAPSADAFDKILIKIKSKDDSHGWIAIAASVSLIVLINTFLIIDYSNSKRQTVANSTDYSLPLVSNYNIY